MEKGKNFELKINNDDFIKIKKDKINYYLIPNGDAYNEICSSSKIILINDNNKKFKKKVKKISVYKSFDGLYEDIKIKRLGYKTNDKKEFEDKYKTDMEDNGLIVIQFKKKKRILFKLCFSILIIIMILLLIASLKNMIDNNNAKKFYSVYQEYKADKVDYVFVEINPSFVLKVKDDKVLDVACLNEDCIKIYDKVDIVGKNTSESIEELYYVSKDNGFSPDGGISIKSTGVDVVSDKIKIDMSYISEQDKDILVKDILNNDTMVDDNNKDYYNKLWNELKKDKDYDNVYTCSMKEDELACYFIMDAITPPLLDIRADALGDLTEYTLKRNKMVNVLDKFGIKNSPSNIFGLSVYIDNTEYSFTPQLEISNGTTNEKFTLRMIFYKQIKNITYENVDGFQIPRYEFGYDYIKIEDINLLNPSKSINKLIKYRMN